MRTTWWTNRSPAVPTPSVPLLLRRVAGLRRECPWDRSIGTAREHINPSGAVSVAGVTGVQMGRWRVAPSPPGAVEGFPSTC